MKRVKLYFTVIMMISICCLEAQVGIKKNGSHPHPSTMLEVSDTASGLLIPRMTTAQRDSIPSPAIGLMIYQINGTNGFYFYDGLGWTAVAGSGIHYPGELYGGGVIFWVDHTGLHGLICSMIDLSTSQVWSNITNVEIGVSAQSIWNGPGNSVAIVGQQGHVTSAANLCLDYVNDPYGTGSFSDGTYRQQVKPGI